MHKEFLETEQRPFPIPQSPWMMTQTWNDILFCHWPVPQEVLRPYIPSEIELDLYDQSAWIGIVLFRVSDMKLRLLPEVPYFNSYIGLNVRTYVTYKGTPGLYFFNLGASKLYAVIGAKMATLLPLRKSLMAFNYERGLHHFEGKARGFSNKMEKFAVSYQATSNPYLPSEGALEFWLYERYCFFVEKNKHIYRGDIHHDQWRICSTDVDIHTNSMASFLPRKYMDDIPFAHYSKKRQAFAWPIKRLA